MKKVVLLLTLIIAVAVVAVVLGVRNWPSDGLDAETVLAQAKAQEDGVLAQLHEGKALHQVDAVYRRYGPAAELIKQMTTEWYLPERYVHEVWFEVGEEGKITQVWGSVKDENGKQLQEIRTVGRQVVTKDVASGAETRLALSLSTNDIKENLQKARESLDGAVLRGDAIITRRAPVLTIEQELSVPKSGSSSTADSLSQGYSIPFVEDIEASRWISRMEVDPATFAISSSSSILLDTAGEEHVVEQWQRMAFEIVDAEQVPSGTQ